MHKIIIPEQIVENPNFKLILVVKELPTLIVRTKYISMNSVLSLHEKLKYTHASVC
jgi:hypothetical protein